MAHKISAHAAAQNASCDVSLDFGGLDAIMQRVIEARQGEVKRISEEWRGETTGWMKEHAPWKDQTGDARGSLGVIPDYQPDVFTYTLTGGVPYMFFLERSHTGRFSILADATHVWGHILLQRAGAIRI